MKKLFKIDSSANHLDYNGNQSKFIISMNSCESCGKEFKDYNLDAYGLCKKCAEREELLAKRMQARWGIAGKDYIDERFAERELGEL